MSEMSQMTPAAAERLEKYLRDVRAALRAAPDVDAGEVEHDVREHVEAALREMEGTVSRGQLDDVLQRLGSPDHWVPEEDVSHWRRALASLQRGPEDWRLSYLTIATFGLGLLALAWVGPLLMVVSFLLGRAAVSLASGRAEELGARKWLVYPPLLFVYFLVAVVLLGWPAAAAPGAFARVGLLHEISEYLGFSFVPPADKHARFLLVAGWGGLVQGLWLLLLGGIFRARPQWFRALFRPFAEGFRARDTRWLVGSGAVLAVAAAALLVLGGPPSLAAQSRSEEPGVTAFRNVHVADPSRGRLLRSRTVLIRGERILRVASPGELEVPGDARVIEGRERYLAPGLTDAHVHLEGEAEEWLDLFLANGVTTVFNMRGSGRHLELRRRVQEGTLIGPTIYTSGPFTNQPEVRTPRDAVRSVREHADRGFDFIKIHGDLSLAAYRRLVSESRESGLPLVGHLPRNLPLDSVLVQPPALVSHAEELVYTGFRGLDTARMQPVARRMAATGTWLSPTLAGFRNLVEQWKRPEALEEAMERPVTRYLNASIRRHWETGNPYVRAGEGARGRERLREELTFQRRLVAALHRAGVPMLAGTDAPFPFMAPGFSLHAELRALQEAGLTAVEALSAATGNPGEFVQRYLDPEDRFGRVESGYRADLVLLGENPLVDPGAYRRPQGVLVRGRWLDRTALERRLERVAERAAASLDESHGTSKLSPRVLSRVTGRFVSAPGGRGLEVTVQADEERLVMEHSTEPESNPRYVLVPVDEGIFRMEGPPVRLYAVLDSTGDTLAIRREEPDGKLFEKLVRSTGQGAGGARGSSANSLPDTLEHTAHRGGLVDSIRARLGGLAAEGAGLQAALARDGEVVWSGAFGPARVEAGGAVTPMSTDTRLRIYSLSKPMTAVAAARLMERGALDPGAPVQEYVPAFPEKAGTITAMHLLRHTSGIRHYRDREESRSTRHCDSVGEALEIFAEDPLVHPPGERQTYSTWGYVLLSAAIEGATGTSYARYMKNGVFRRAGMEHTVIDDPTVEVPGRVSFYSVAGTMDPAGPPGHPVRENGKRELVPAEHVDNTCKWGGGAWLSTAEDVARFLAASMDGRLVSAEALRRLTGGTSRYEAMGLGAGGMAFARADLDSRSALVVLSNGTGEVWGPRVRKAVDELFRELVLHGSGE